MPLDDKFQIGDDAKAVHIFTDDKGEAGPAALLRFSGMRLHHIALHGKTRANQWGYTEKTQELRYGRSVTVSHTCEKFSGANSVVYAPPFESRITASVAANSNGDGHQKLAELVRILVSAYELKGRVVVWDNHDELYRSPGMR